MHTIFESDDTDAVLFIDASNAFNALNRAAALQNIRILCPIIAIYAINTYKQPARLFVIGGKEIESAEGTTQGDPLRYTTSYRHGYLDFQRYRGGRRRGL